MKRAGKKSRGVFQLRYGAYARDHGMTSEQMLAHDKKCYPFALLTPYLLWVSLKWFEWGELNPGRKIYSAHEEANLDRWLGQLSPACDALTCECHAASVNPPPGH